MVSDNPTLNACLDVANDFETALNSLGDTSQWPADHALRQRCAEFRYAARDLAEQKGLNQFAIAFIGPKNAGKTTLLSLLLRSKTIKEQLASGEGIRGTTEKIQWISSEPISDLDRRVEESVHIVPSDVAKLGCDYTLIDVPGANEAHPLRAAAAARALRTAHLKVLVAEARTIEDASLLDYLQDADGATILPVINLAPKIRTSADFSIAFNLPFQTLVFSLRFECRTSSSQAKLKAPLTLLRHSNVAYVMWSARNTSTNYSSHNFSA